MTLPKIPTFEELLKKVKLPKVPVKDLSADEFDASQASALGIKLPQGWKLKRSEGVDTLLSPRGLTFSNLKMDKGKVVDFQAFHGDRPVPLATDKTTQLKPLPSSVLEWPEEPQFPTAPPPLPPILEWPEEPQYPTAPPPGQPPVQAIEEQPFGAPQAVEPPITAEVGQQVPQLKEAKSLYEQRVRDIDIKYRKPDSWEFKDTSESARQAFLGEKKQAWEEYQSNLPGFEQSLWAKIARIISIPFEIVGAQTRNIAIGTGDVGQKQVEKLIEEGRIQPLTPYEELPVWEQLLWETPAFLDIYRTGPKLAIAGVKLLTREAVKAFLKKGLDKWLVTQARLEGTGAQSKLYPYLAKTGETLTGAKNRNAFIEEVTNSFLRRQGRTPNKEQAMREAFEEVESLFIPRGTQTGIVRGGISPKPTTQSVVAKLANNQVLNVEERQLYASQSQAIEAALQAQVTPTGAEVAPRGVTVTPPPGITPTTVTPTEAVVPKAEEGVPVEKTTTEEKLSSKYGIWDSYTDYGAAVSEANTLRKLGWQVRITEAQTPTGKRFRVWTTTKRRKILDRLPYKVTPTAKLAPTIPTEPTTPEVTPPITLPPSIQSNLDKARQIREEVAFIDKASLQEVAESYNVRSKETAYNTALAPTSGTRLKKGETWRSKALHIADMMEQSAERMRPEVTPPVTKPLPEAAQAKIKPVKKEVAPKLAEQVKAAPPTEPPPPVKPPPEGIAEEPKGDPVAKLTNLVKLAKPVRGETELLKHEELSKRAGRLAGAIKAGEGEAAFQKAKSALKGELPQAVFQPPRQGMTTEDVTGLFNTIRDSDLPPFQKLNTSEALSAILGGKLPTRGDIALLEKMFGSDLAKALLAHRPLSQKAWDIFLEVWNIPRTLMASGELSGSLRQGAFILPSHPKVWGRSMWAQLRATAKEKNAIAIDKDLQTNPGAELREQYKVFHAPISGVGSKLTEREEVFISNFFERFTSWWEKEGLVKKVGTSPLYPIAKGVRISERAYITFLNKLRADIFDTTVDTWRKTGVPPTPEELQRLSNFVNNATGRGTLGKLENSAPALSGVFFSPRLQASRIGLFWDAMKDTIRAANDIAHGRRVNRMSAENLKAVVAFVGTGLMILGLAKLNGADVEDDPRSADFGKIKIGNTRLDIWSSFQPYARFISNMITGMRKSSVTGKVTEVKRSDILINFIRTKLMPTTGFIYDVLEGKTFKGEDLDLSVEQASERLAPMFWQDMAEAIELEGLVGGFKALPGFLGVGVQTYANVRESELQISESISKLGKEDIESRKEAVASAIEAKVSKEKLREINAKDWTYDITSLRRDIGDALRRVSEKDIAQLDPITGNLVEFKAQDEEYRTLGDKEQEKYVKDNPDYLTNRLFWGEITTIPDLATAKELVSQAEKYNIPLNMIPAFQRTDSGKERVPSDQEVWPAYFDFTAMTEENSTEAEREKHLKDNPKVDAFLLLQGDRTTIHSLEAALQLEKDANDQGIPLDSIEAFSETDKGKERLPSDRDLWEAYFAYYDLPGGSYLNMSQEQVDAGNLPQKHRVAWDAYNNAKTDKVKELYRKKYREAAYSKWRDDFRRLNPEFNQWLIDQGYNKPLPIPKKTISRTGRARTPLASVFGGGVPRPRQARVTYPTFPGISRGISIKAPSVPGF